MMNKTLIEINNVSKLFYTPLAWRKILSLNFKNIPVLALKDISLSIPEKSIVGILGENGAGKTTLLKIISTIILPDAGKVKVKNYSTELDEQKIKSFIGLVASEERSFYWRLTGLQNLEFYSAMYGLDKAKTKLRINNLFKIFKISYEDKRFDTYSTGMKRKFALIRALLHDPDILLLDEPTKSLDFSTALELKNMIKNLRNQGKTVLYATHNIDDAQNLCDRFIILNKGKLLASGIFNELQESVKSKPKKLSEIYTELLKNDT